MICPGGKVLSGEKRGELEEDAAPRVERDRQTFLAIIFGSPDHFSFMTAGKSEFLQVWQPQFLQPVLERAFLLIKGSLSS